MESDESLYRRVRQGDMQAFDGLYQRYEKRIFGFVLRMLHNRQDAEDLFHEAFLSVLKSREVQFDRGSFCTWIYRIARNLCLNRLRSARRGDGAMARLTEPASAETAEERLLECQLSVALGQAVARLPPGLSELYHLRSSGLSYEDMAAVLEVPLGTVKSRMNQMVNRLREEVLPWAAP